MSTYVLVCIVFVTASTCESCSSSREAKGSILKARYTPRSGTSNAVSSSDMGGPVMRNRRCLRPCKIESSLDVAVRGESADEDEEEEEEDGGKQSGGWDWAPSRHHAVVLTL